MNWNIKIISRKKIKREKVSIGERKLNKKKDITNPLKGGIRKEIILI